MGAPAGSPTAARRAGRLDVDEQHLLFELTSGAEQLAVGAHHEGRTVEHQLVLATDLVHVDDRAAGLGHPFGEHRQTLLTPAPRVGGGVEIDQHPRTGIRLLAHRSVLEPHVLADRHPDRHAAHHEGEGAAAARDEPALLVEDAVIREYPLVVAPEDPSSRTERRRVEQPPGRGHGRRDRPPPRRPGWRRPPLRAPPGCRRRRRHARAGPRAGSRSPRARGRPPGPRRHAPPRRARRESVRRCPTASPTTVFTWHAATRMRSTGRQPTGAFIRAFLPSLPRRAEFIGRSRSRNGRDIAAWKSGSRRGDAAGGSVGRW